LRNFAIAGLQLELGNRDNFDAVAREIALAKARRPWLDMVVLSELCLFGVAPSRAVPLPGSVEERLQAIAAREEIWLVAGSLYETDGERVFNTAPVIDPAGRVVARHRKIFPFLPYEQGVAGGDRATLFDVPGIGRFGVSICYDMWFGESTRWMACQGAEVIVHPTLTNTIDRDVELAIARAAAATNQCYFVDINGAGDLAVGRSIVCGPGGEIIHQAGAGREIIAVTLDLDQARHAREQGWHGLGQVLKSFRDAEFGVDGKTLQRSEALKELGPLAMPPGGRWGKQGGDQHE
jgi:predicted amidohydrolase